ncbi:MAG: gliding motility protein GldL [Bacteroidaceae bacterium]
MNIIIKIQKWMDSPAGQVFMNYAYSWGAAIVILGTLFKLTHLAGANAMLFIGMGTEVLVFFISGFDKPYEKVPAEEQQTASQPSAASAGQTVVIQRGAMTNGDAEGQQSGTIIVGAPMGQPVAGVQPAIVPSGTTILGGSVQNGSIDPEALSNATGLSAAAANLAAAGQAAAAAQAALDQLQNGSAPSLDPSLARSTDPAEVEEAVQNYAQELRELTEVLVRVKEQAARMSTDSEEMENLNRTLTGIATVYELQLRNISKQVSTIEQIDEQTRRMAQQIEELNNVYGRMIKALTINMTPVSAAQPAPEQA